MTYTHHEESIRRTTEHFAADAHVMGLLLGGSIAHGFHSSTSDVDVMIVVSDDDHRERLRTGQTCFFSRELCTYDGGYVDGKYVAEGMIRAVAAKGSEPARFAFQDARVLFAHNDTLPQLVAEAGRYPVEGKAGRIRRFQAQVEAWSWYTGEAIKRDNLPLLRLAVAKLTLFAGRIVLANNELLYPYHKWFLRVLEAAPDKPANFVGQINGLARNPSPAAIEEFVRGVKDFRGWEITHATWPAQFMEDSELNWLHQAPPVDDL